MTPRPTRSEGEPHDRLTRLTGVAGDAIEASPDYQGEKLIIFMTGNGRAGTNLRGYDDEAEALTDLFMHMRAMFRSAGKDLQLYSFPPPSG